ncbi:MAG: SlyX family protein [Gammaproteobacteria bacterium]|nr:SlyX family protein [Gammaproteobacteria bacterium]
MTASLLEDLEVKVAFLEEALSQLSDEHYKQQRELDALKQQYVTLIDRLAHRDSETAGDPPVDDDPPPHY